MSTKAKWVPFLSIPSLSELVSFSWYEIHFHEHSQPFEPSSHKYRSMGTRKNKGENAAHPVQNVLSEKWFKAKRHMPPGGKIAAAAPASGNLSLSNLHFGSPNKISKYYPCSQKKIICWCVLVLVFVLCKPYGLRILEKSRFPKYLFMEIKVYRAKVTKVLPNGGSSRGSSFLFGVEFRLG